MRKPKGRPWLPPDVKRSYDERCQACGRRYIARATAAEMAPILAGRKPSVCPSCVKRLKEYQSLFGSWLDEQRGDC